MDNINIIKSTLKLKEKDFSVLKYFYIIKFYIYLSTSDWFSAGQYDFVTSQGVRKYIPTCNTTNYLLVWVQCAYIFFLIHFIQLTSWSNIFLENLVVA
jgi:hypothetical protein